MKLKLLSLIGDFKLGKVRRNDCEEAKSLTPERQRIAKIFKDHIEKAINELGPGYTVDLQGNFYDTPSA
jgi:hypothetical protein